MSTNEHGSKRARVIAVTGASGFVGRTVVRELVSRGWGVRALVRDRAKASAALTSDPLVERVFGDVFDAGALRDVMSGCDGVVHTIGIRRELPPDISFERMHPRATRGVLNAAADAGARRFVHISALGTRPGAASKYHRSKYESETLVRASGLEWTILRPSIIHGAEGEFMQMARDWTMGRTPPYFFLPYFVRPKPAEGFGPPQFESARVQPVSVNDVAFAAAESLVREEAIGEVYPLGGAGRFDWPEMLMMIRDALPTANKKMKARGLPGHLAFALATAAEQIGVGAALPFGPSEPMMAMEDSVCSNEKAWADLAYEPGEFGVELRGYAAKV